MKSALVLLLIVLFTVSEGARRTRGNPNTDSSYHRPEVPGSEFKAEQKTSVQQVKDETPVGECEEIERDCMGVCFGTMVKDACGTCGGHNESCKGCDGVPNSGKERDCFNVCGGTAQRDCEGVCGGLAARDTNGACCSVTRIDDCGVCYGNNACTDCHGDLDGTATIDDCGVCSGGDTGTIANAAKDCSGTCHGSARLDECEVCSGGTANHEQNSDKDCDGVCFGDSARDACGVCKGDGTSCRGCDGVANSGKVLDICGTCGGDNSECCGPYGACNNLGTCDAEDGGCLCDFGWGGRECTRRQDPCRWQSCGTRGSCNSETGGCVCEQGFWGPQCELSRCSGHGRPTLTGGKCKNCFEGYGGHDCSECTEPKMKHHVFACLLKFGQSVIDREVDEAATAEAGTTVYRPLRFSLIATPKDTLDALIGGWDTLTKLPYQLAILPGSLYNGTTYGCNCQPAIPFEDIQHYFTRQTKNEEEEKGTTKKRLDSQTIRGMSVKERMVMGDDFKISTRFVSHAFVRALTAIEASDFLNEIFEFFDVIEDAQTGTPETVGNAVDEVKEVARIDMALCILYFSIVVSVVLGITIGALVVMFFITGGRITRGGGSSNGEDFDEVGGEEQLYRMAMQNR